MVVFVLTFYDADAKQVEVVAVSNTLLGAVEQLGKLACMTSQMAAALEFGYSATKRHWSYSIDTGDGELRCWITEREVGP